MSEVTPNQPMRKKSRPWRGAMNVGALLAALAGGYMLRGTTGQAQQGGEAPPETKAPVVETPATRGAAAMQNAFADVANAVEPAVVTITTRRSGPPPRRGPGGGPFDGPGGNTPGAPGGPGGSDPFEEFFRRFRDYGFSPNSAQKEEMRRNFYKVQERGGGVGSGMIYRADGYILTNAHVVQGADDVTVKLFDGREFKRAKVIGSDERTDVAVIKIEGQQLPTVKFGNSGDVRVGDWAIAIGNPFNLTSTLTVGVISAKAREVDLSLNSRSPGDYLQTDASINPGNSGGPLCDIYGRVIGVNNAIYSQSGGNIGIGFAIPINTARDIADRLVKSGRIQRGYLGVRISSMEDRAAAFGLDPNTKGVLIEEVTDTEGPAAKAGLQVGDIIVEFNGKPVTRSAELQRLVGDAPVNSTATMKVLRAGKGLTVSARLTELKEEGGPAAPRRVPDREGEEDTGTSVGLGLRMSPLTPALTQRFGIKDTRGVVVLSVEPNSPGANSLIRPGDVIERVGQTAVTTPQEVQAAVKALLDRQTGDDKQVALYVNTKGQRRFVTVEVTP